MFLKRLFASKQHRSTEPNPLSIDVARDFLTDERLFNERYRIEKSLSQNIYLAIDLSTDIDSVVIERIQIDRHKKRASYVFDREAAKMLKISQSCPAMARLIDYFSNIDRDSVNFYLVSEYIEGQTIG